MTTLEEALFIEMQSCYEHSLIVELGRLGYYGSLFEPFDPAKLKPAMRPVDRANIEQIFKEAPRLKGVHISRKCKSIAGKFHTKVSIEVDRSPTYERSGAIGLVKDCTPVTRLIDPDLCVGYIYPKTVYIILDDDVTDEEIFTNLGFKFPKDGYDPADGEEIEIDIDNPFTIDFPTISD